MIIFDPLLPSDIFSLDIANLDSLSENFSFEYYLEYMQLFPHYFIAIKSLSPSYWRSPSVPSGEASICFHPILGYIFGRLEHKPELCLHVSGLTVAPSIRKRGLGTQLLDFYVTGGDSAGVAFCDLYVRSHNLVAIRFYEKNGYVVYRKVKEYYTDPVEDACDMRRPLRADPERKCLVGGVDLYFDEL